LLRESVLELPVALGLFERLDGRGAVAVVDLEGVDGVLRRAEEGVNPAVVRQRDGEVLEGARGILEVAVEVRLQRRADAPRGVGHDQRARRGGAGNGDYRGGDVRRRGGVEKQRGI